MEKDIKGIDFRPYVPFCVKFTKKKVIILTGERDIHYTVEQIRREGMAFGLHKSDELKKKSGKPHWEELATAKLKINLERTHELEEKLKETVFSINRDKKLTLQEIRKRSWLLFPHTFDNFPVKQRVAVFNPENIKDRFIPSKEFRGERENYLVFSKVKGERKLVGGLLASGGENYIFLSYKDLKKIASIFRSIVQLVDSN